MNFVSPHWLWILAAAPLLIAAYFALLRRTRAVRFSNVAIVRAATTRGNRWRRHVPPLLLLGALIALVIGIARPSAYVALPSQYKTIVLVIDTSLSMRANDVMPNRITVAQAAARAFVDQVPSDVRIGLVEFGGTASAVQMPTSNRDDLIGAIDRFRLQRGTATGSALYVALSMLFPDAGIDLESILMGNRRPQPGPDRRASRNRPLGQEERPAQESAVAAVPPGSYESGVVILLSDGRRTTGPDPLDAAQWAAERGVKVYTVGFGTKEGASIDFGEWSFYVRLDEETLKAVADVTRGQYFHAGTADDLKTVYAGLNNKLVLERQRTELTALFAAGAALLTMLAGLLSILWFGRVD
ncbi:MAG: VWA domain-containing protein [Lautropia sp.]